jgi:hypothetical protein
MYLKYLNIDLTSFQVYKSQITNYKVNIMV